MKTAIEWHSCAESFPTMDGEAYAAFKADLAGNGQKVSIKYRLVNGKKQGIDGRNRERAMIELGKEPIYERVWIDDADVEAYIDSQNFHRRHLSKEFRQSRVDGLRKQGQSTRQIAENLGVSQSTVQRDISESEKTATKPGHGEPNDSPTPGQTSEKSKSDPEKSTPTPQVVGKNGIKQPAKKTAKPDREPGDDTEQIAEAAKANRQAQRRNGKQLFDDRIITDLIRKFVQAIDARKKAFGESAGFRAVEKAMSAVATAWEGWRKE